MRTTCSNDDPFFSILGFLSLKPRAFKMKSIGEPLIAGMARMGYFQIQNGVLSLITKLVVYTCFISIVLLVYISLNSN